MDLCFGNRSAMMWNSLNMKYKLSVLQSHQFKCLCQWHTLSGTYGVPFLWTIFKSSFLLLTLTKWTRVGWRCPTIWSFKYHLCGSGNNNRLTLLLLVLWSSWQPLRTAPSSRAWSSPGIRTTLQDVQGDCRDVERGQYGGRCSIWGQERKKRINTV